MVTLVNWLMWFTACGPSIDVPAGHRAQRHHALPVVALDVQQIQILRIGAVDVRHFQNHLVLIVRLFDQIGVILRIGIVQQRRGCAFPRRRTAWLDPAEYPPADWACD